MENEQFFDEPYECPYHPGNMITGYCQDPYAADVHNDPDALMLNCAECVYQAAMDI
jgi:hypothetical protein